MSWTLIEHQALTSSVASVTLGNGGTLPQTYKTLKLVASTRTDRAATDDTLGILFNGSSSNFSFREVYGNGASPFSGSGSQGRIILAAAANNTASTFANSTTEIPNYAGATNKPVSSDSVSENNATTAYQIMYATLWSNTAAITSITVQSLFGSNLVSGSTFTLYGLK